MKLKEEKQREANRNKEKEERREKEKEKQEAKSIKCDGRRSFPATCPCASATILNGVQSSG